MSYETNEQREARRILQRIRCDSATNTSERLDEAPSHKADAGDDDLIVLLGKWLAAGIALAVLFFVLSLR